MSSEANLLNPPDTIRAVICYLRRGDNFLLLLKTSGKFGAGFWNAPGGKIQPGESAEEAAGREVTEETGLTLRKVVKIGFLEFYFGEGKMKPDWTAEVFVSHDFTGKVRESSEGKLKWFPINKLPMDQMWEDDRYWLPLLVAGKKFRGKFEFSGDSKKLISYKIGQLPNLK
ncbi:MAG: 8-oxo-dGTP diphosphatase [Thaumarchaeota archaeon]|nr:8-oxo-dGTP diphosphatase [Nitrososphaerota archaeon]